MDTRNPTGGDDEVRHPSKQNALRDMVSEVAESPALYRPSRFWTDLNEINQTMLDELGLENLKRTVAQNYFNWLITSKQGSQYRAVRKLWIRRSSLQPYLNELEYPSLLRTSQSYVERLKGPSIPGTALGAKSEVSRAELRVYKVFVGMLCEYAMQQDWSAIGG